MGYEKDTILIVDDEKHIRDIISLYLKKEGFNVVVAENGQEAFDKAKEIKPIVILSDSMMPIMDGRDFCQKVKADQEIKNTMFVMLTGKTELNDKLEGFDIGADEYLTKPFNNQELMAKVKSYVKIGKLQRELKEKNNQLQDLDKLKNDLTHMIVHDMKTPISGILLSLEILFDSSNDSFTEDQRMFLMNCKSSAGELYHMVLNLLDISQIEEGKLELNKVDFSLKEVFEKLQFELSYAAQQRNLELDFDIEGADIVVNGDKDILKRVIMNMVTNGLKHTYKGNVSMVAKKIDDKIEIGVKDSGEGIPEDQQKIIFEKFSQVKTSMTQINDTGLGLTFCKLAVEAHDSSLKVSSVLDEGSYFYFQI